MRQAVIVYAARTPIGKFLGSFTSLPAPRLGAALVKDALLKTGLSPFDIDEIIMGQVLTAGCGQAPARQTALYGGLSNSVCASTINRVCGSGLKSVMTAEQALSCGDAEIIFAGGQENMSMAPHLMLDSRKGYRYGSVEVKDHMQWDGLTNPYDGAAMGSCGEICAKDYGFSRVEQDEFALKSYLRAREAIKNGYFNTEIVPVDVIEKKKTITISQDEEPLNVDLVRLPNLSPAFSKDGTITAGNASSISDGAAMLVLTEEEEAKKKHLQPLAKIIVHGSHAQEPAQFATAPIKGIEKVLRKGGFTVEDIDLFEINEAFAVVPMAAIRDLKLDPQKVNVCGGAISLGHPIGASGARILVTLIHSLRRLRLKRGLASLCIGGGESSSMIVEVEYPQV